MFRPGKKREDHRSTEKKREDQRRREKKREDQRRREKREDQRTPEKKREDQRTPEKKRKDEELKFIFSSADSPGHHEPEVKQHNDTFTRQFSTHKVCQTSH